MHAGAHRVRLLFASNCGVCCLLWRTPCCDMGSQRLEMCWTLLVMTQALCLGFLSSAYAGAHGAIGEILIIQQLSDTIA